jgi:hypothetical protein
MLSELASMRAGFETKNLEQVRSLGNAANN